MRKDPSTPIPHLLNATFHSVDTQLSALSAAEGTHSGCTAVTCLLRLEDENGNPVGEGSGVAPHIVGGEKGKLDGKPGEACEAAEAVGIDPTEGKPGSGEGQHPGGAHADLSFASMYCCCFGWRLICGEFSVAPRLPSRWQRQEQDQEHALVVGQQAEFAHELHLVYAVEPEPGLWTCRGGQGSEANALHRQRRRCACRPLVSTLWISLWLRLEEADHGVLVFCSRGGRAIRLSYDHKAGDAKEMQRIEAAGGYIANQRENGYLAVTRSLGDSQMKQFVVGSPYTTETTLRDDDDFLILACDGVSWHSSSSGSVSSLVN